MPRRYPRSIRHMTEREQNEWERHFEYQERHRDCADDPCDDCHRAAGGLFCAECGEQIQRGDFCSPACDLAWHAANPDYEPYQPTSVTLRKAADAEQADGQPATADYLRSLARSVEVIERFSASGGRLP